MLVMTMQPENEPTLSVTPPQAPRGFVTIPAYIRHNYDFGADETAMSQKQGRVWKKITWRKYYDTIRQLSLALISLGLEHGDIVCIIGNNEPEWFWSQFAVQAAGGIASCIPAEVTSTGLKSIAGQCKAKFAVVRDQAQITKFQAIRDDPTAGLKKIIYWNSDGLKNAKDSLLIDFAAALKLGEEFEKKNPDVFEQNIDKGTADDVAAIYYTAGTNEAPEGIVMTQKALISSGQGLLLRFPVRANFNLISNFPVTGVENRCFAAMPHILTGAVLNFPQSTGTLIADMRITRTNFVVYGPKQWETTAAEIQAKIKSNPLTKFYAGLFLPGGYKLADARISNKRPNFFRLLLNIPAYFLLFRPLRSSFGLHRVRFAASDGLVLNPETFRFLQAVGINLRQAYALDETGVIAGQGKEEIDFAPVGRPTANTEVRITPEGILLVRGDTLFSGYQGDPQKTAAALVDGWYHTGISADIDGKGQLVINKK